MAFISFYQWKCLNNSKFIQILKSRTSGKAASAMKKKIKQKEKINAKETNFVKQRMNNKEEEEKKCGERYEYV